MNGTRRTFLGTALGAAATVALSSPAMGSTAAGSAAAPSTTYGAERGRCHRRIPPSGLGMHLYTMRKPLATDFKGTLARLAEMGYATVGVSGRHGNDAAAIRRMLDQTRLKAVLEHVGYNIVTGSGLPQALDDIHTLGARWIVVPSLPGALHTPAGFREAARQFNKAGLAARRAGLAARRAGLAARRAGLGPLLFHNHGLDHEVVEGENLYDILLTETDPDLVGFELDVYWAAKGGADPRSLFVRHRRRFPALHVKDMAPNGDFADVGSGVLDFPAMFDTARSGGVKQWLVEHDSPADPFATARNSYRYLSRLRY